MTSEKHIPRKTACRHDGGRSTNQRSVRISASRHDAERHGVRHGRLVNHVPREGGRAERPRARQKRNRAAELAPQAEMQDNQPGGHRQPRRQERRLDVPPPKAERDAGRSRPHAGGRAAPVAGGNEQIRRRPDDSRAYRDDMMRTGRLTESGDLGADVETAIEDDAPQVREVQRTIAAWTELLARATGQVRLS